MYFIEKKTKKKTTYMARKFFFTKSFQIPPKITQVGKHASHMNTIHLRNHCLKTNAWTKTA